jgi:phosphoribosylformimino-5-aminoimidazole carboxamide ribotide isomerase
VGTLAVENPNSIAGLDPEKVILALDMKNGEIVTRGWVQSAGRSTEAICCELKALGFHIALVTDVGRDGTMEGPGVEAIGKVAALGFEVQASGGLRSLVDLEGLKNISGVTGAISGKALLDGALRLDDPAVRQAVSGGL